MSYITKVLKTSEVDTAFDKIEFGIVAIDTDHMSISAQITFKDAAGAVLKQESVSIAGDAYAAWVSANLAWVKDFRNKILTIGKNEGIIPQNYVDTWGT